MIGWVATNVELKYSHFAHSRRCVGKALFYHCFVHSQQFLIHFHIHAVHVSVHRLSRKWAHFLDSSRNENQLAKEESVCVCGRKKVRFCRQKDLKINYTPAFIFPAIIEFVSAMEFNLFYNLWLPMLFFFFF